MLFLLRFNQPIMCLSHSTIVTLITQRGTYQLPSFEAFYDSLIREQQKLLYVGLINIVGTSNKALVE